MEFYGHIIARLDGKEIKENFDRYRDLVNRGIAGFIVFGGDLEDMRRHIHKLQEAAGIPLIIASDLEQGVGQQVTGGTLFPPAMALARAVDTTMHGDLDLIKDVFTAYGDEALYAGINTILAPVVDINTNPHNPIISARSFGEDKETVSSLSGLMIETLQSNGVVACAKHFPGHGNTGIDSHISLPVLHKDMNDLEETELHPFRRSVEKGVQTIMLGHISVPSIDPEGTPVSVSGNAVKYIRKTLGFDGLLMTDALNMGGLSSIGQNEAGAMALNAGVDILLHPDDPDELNAYLQKNKVKSDTKRVERLKKTLKKETVHVPDFKKNNELAQYVTERAITLEGVAGELIFSSVIIIKDDEGLSYGIFERFIREKYSGLKIFEIKDGDTLVEEDVGYNLLTVIFSTTAAWKGNLPEWFSDTVDNVKGKTQLFIVFGNPYVVHDIRKPKMLTYWCSEQAEKAMVKIMRNV